MKYEFFKVGNFKCKVCQLSLSQVRVVFTFQLVEIYTDLDGFSGKIVGFVTMPVKNNIEIYAHSINLSIS